MDLFKSLENKSGKKLKTIIFPESYDPRVIEAVKDILKKKIAAVVLISDINKSEKDLESLIHSQSNLLIIDIHFAVNFLKEYHGIKIKKKPEYTFKQSESEIPDPLTFSCMLLRNKFADGIIAGSVYSTAEVLRNSISLIGLSKNNKTVSSFFLFTFPRGHRFRNRVFAYADCGVIPDPDAGQLSDIAIQTASNFKKLTGLIPRVAFLSFSTKGSAKDGTIDKVIDAFNLTRKRKPGLICDGELQFDAAFVPEIALRKNPSGKIKGDANVFIFPDLNSGNIAYKITERIGGATATGPIIQGLAKPVMDLSRGCSSTDIVNMTRVIFNL